MNLLAIVVDRRTGEVIDSEKYTYGLYLDDLIVTHDLTQVDIIIREVVKTNKAEVSVEPAEIPKYTASTADDVPF